MCIPIPKVEVAFQRRKTGARTAFARKKLHEEQEQEQGGGTQTLVPNPNLTSPIA